MNKKYYAVSIALTMGLTPVVSTEVFAKEDVKDVYIDETVDESVSYVTGYVTVIDPETGNETTEIVYDQAFSVTYSNPCPEEVSSGMDEARSAINDKALEYGDDYDEEFQEAVGKVWDNRSYTTVEDGDAVLIGDTDYLDGAYGASDYTRTHIASGGYGKETFYTLTGIVIGTKQVIEAPVEVEEPVEPPVQEIVKPIEQSAPAAPAVQPQVSNVKSVNTGILNHFTLWMTSALSSLAGAVILLRKRK